MQLVQIAHIIGSNIEIPTDIEINWLLIDSRSLTFPAESLFFALVSQRNNGHQYIQDLYRQGVRAFVVSELRPDFKNMPDAFFLEVENTLDALQQVVAAHRSAFDMPVVGITGSNGKTIVKEWLFQLLQEDFEIVRSPRSYNSQIGVPLSVWQLKPNTELAVFEAGISKVGEMERLEQILRPTIGIFTNIGDAHQENFADYSQKIREKLQLFAHSGHIIYGSDNPILHAEIIRTKAIDTLLNWGKSTDNYVQLLEVQKVNGKTNLLVQWQNIKFTFCIPFTDDASVENVMHCITLMFYLEYTPETISQRLLQLEPVAMRLELKQGIRECLLINDSYNADLNALNIALDFLSQQAVSKQLSKTIILSDILQSGFKSDELYKQVAALIKAKHIHKLIGVGDEISKHADLFEGIDTQFFSTTQELLQDAVMLEFRNEAVLLKGSRKYGFEEVSHRLELIAHETVLEVNLNALIDNLNYFRSNLSDGTKIMCMVKAFGYGSGSVETAKALQHHRADYLAVAVADEGAELRHSGIHIPIVVMNPEKSTFDLLFANNLEPEIYSFNLLKAFVKAVGKLGLTDYPIHIKIDTGMHRLGFEPEEMDQLIQYLQQCNQVKVKSVFTHLAGADDEHLDEFTHQQMQTFTFCTQQFTKSFAHPILRHILNSAGIERFPAYQLDMVRLGIGHYGVSALPDVHLQQVCTLKTIVLQLKKVKAGETVGYNRNGKVETDKLIAILPIGYADGYDRKLSNGLGEVYVQGQYAPVIGNISMDLTAVDVTGIDVSEGDVVEIFGDHITISALAKKLNTIPYEILTSVSKRVKRVYFQE